MTIISTTREVPAAGDRARRARVVAGSLAVLLVLGVVAAAVVLATRDDTADGPVEGLLTFPGLSREHVPEPVYTDPVPPVGGDHLPWWQDCGAYDAPVPDGAAVHSMEHGAVWLAHAPDLPATEVAVLDDLAARYPYLLVSPRDGLPSPVVASAWGVQLRLDAADDPRLSVFLVEYLQGPQTPEPGAPCTGGSAGMP